MTMITGMFGFTERTQSREEGLGSSQKEQELTSTNRKDPGLTNCESVSLLKVCVSPSGL